LGTAALASIDGIWDELFYPFVRVMVHQLVDRITIGTASIKIALSLEGFGKAVLSLLPRGSFALVCSGHQNARLHEPTLAKYGKKITKTRKTKAPDLRRKRQEVVSKIAFETPFWGNSPKRGQGPIAKSPALWITSRSESSRVRPDRSERPSACH
jgi:hypothetical protein